MGTFKKEQPGGHGRRKGGWHLSKTIFAGDSFRPIEITGSAIGGWFGPAGDTEHLSASRMWDDWMGSVGVGASTATRGLQPRPPEIRSEIRIRAVLVSVFSFSLDLFLSQTDNLPAGSGWILNLPPTVTGQIPAEWARPAIAFGKALRASFSAPAASLLKANATVECGSAAKPLVLDLPARPAPFASRSVRRALLTPQVHPGSHYRCGRSTYEQPVSCDRRKGDYFSP